MLTQISGGKGSENTELEKHGDKGSEDAELEKQGGKALEDAEMEQQGGKGPEDAEMEQQGGKGSEDDEMEEQMMIEAAVRQEYDQETMLNADEPSQIDHQTIPGDFCYQSRFKFF